MIGRLRRLQLGLELVRGAVLVVAGSRMAVAAAREFLAADKAATVAHLEQQETPKTTGLEEACERFHPGEPCRPGQNHPAAAETSPELEPVAGGDDAA